MRNSTSTLRVFYCIRNIIPCAVKVLRGIARQGNQMNGGKNYDVVPEKGDQVLKELGVSDEGLTAAKASEVLKEKGENVLLEGRKKVPSRCFLNSLKTFW